MPIVHVHLRAGRSSEQKRTVLDGVHRAFVEAFAIPEEDRNQVLHEHAPEHFQAKYGPDTVFVEASVILGRSADAKRKLYALLVEYLAGAGVPRDAVLIVLHEAPVESWGMRGGRSAADV